VPDQPDVGVVELAGVRPVVPDGLPDVAGFVGLDGIVGHVGIEPVVAPAVDGVEPVVQRVELTDIVAVGEVVKVSGPDHGRRRPARREHRAHHHRGEAALAEGGVVDAPVAQVGDPPGLAARVLEGYLGGPLVGVLRRVDDLLGALGRVLVEVVDRRPAALVVGVAHELRPVAVGLVAGQVDAVVDVVAPAAPALGRFGQEAVPLALTALLVAAVDEVAVALDDAQRRVVALLGRAVVRDAQFLVLEGVEQLLREGDLVHLRLGRVLRDDDDAVLVVVVEAADRGGPARPARRDRVLVLADGEHRLPLDVLVEAVGRRGDVLAVVYFPALPELLAGDDFDGHRFLELEFADGLDAGRRPRDDSVEFRLVEAVLARDRQGLVVPAAALPAEAVGLRVLARAPGERSAGVVVRNAGPGVGRRRVVGSRNGGVLRGRCVINTLSRGGRGGRGGRGRSRGDHQQTDQRDREG